MIPNSILQVSKTIARQKTSKFFINRARGRMFEKFSNFFESDTLDTVLRCVEHDGLGLKIILKNGYNQKNLCSKVLPNQGINLTPPETNLSCRDWLCMTPNFKIIGWATQPKNIGRTNPNDVAIPSALQKPLYTIFWHSVAFVTKHFLLRRFRQPYGTLSIFCCLFSILIVKSTKNL